MEPVNKVTGKINFQPNVFLNSNLSSAAKVDVPEFRNALDAAHAELGNAKCLDGPKSLDKIRF